MYIHYCKRGDLLSTSRNRKSPCHCINLRRTTNIVSELYDQYLEPVGLTVNQFSLIINLYYLESGSVTDLAKRVGLERTTLVRTLKPLLDRGFIEDLSVAGKRNRKLRLTELGKKALENGKPLWDKAQKEIERRIGKEKIELLYEIMALLEEE